MKSKKILIKGAKTPLEKFVQKSINYYAQGYNDGAKGFAEDLMQGGCSSGIVTELIYYKDTIKFYKKYKKEIQELIKEILLDTGEKSLPEIFGKSWDGEDIFAEETQNQNLLAWFGYEETARKLFYLNNIEV